MEKNPPLKAMSFFEVYLSIVPARPNFPLGNLFLTKFQHVCRRMQLETQESQITKSLARERWVLRMSFPCCQIMRKLRKPHALRFPRTYHLQRIISYKSLPRTH